MNAKLIALASLLASGLAWSQDIVLKACFGGTVSLVGYSTKRDVEPIDVNGDGIKEQPVNCTHLLDPINLHIYQSPGVGGTYCEDYQTMYVSSLRGSGTAEWVLLGGNPDWNYYRIYDIQTNDLLLQIPCEQANSRALLFDYDLDGTDDLIVGRANGTMEVYGVANGNPPISPPQELDIQQVGQDYVVTWDTVPSATAYRVEWSSAIDGLRFTRIGYTTGTTFIHRNQVGQERGFYRVLSEDNGTGVVRMVGQTSLGR